MDHSQLKFAKTHEWVSLEGDVATIGISPFAVNLLSDLVFIDLPKPGRVLAVNETFGEVESVKAVSDLYSPVAGEVIETHGELANHLDWLSQDAFGKGWMIKVRITNHDSLAQLLDSAAYKLHCQSEAH